MSSAAVALVVSASLYAGFQATVRLVVYPQFSAVGSLEFAAYEASHQRRISFVVGPLFAALLLSTAAVVVDGPGGAPSWAVPASVFLLLVILGVTGGLAVPLHRRLGDGFDAVTYRRLLAVDTIRLAAAVLDAAVAVVLVMS
jgi:hypothetical protein